MGLSEEYEQLYSDSMEALAGIAAYKSPFLNQRVKQQHGYFTVHGGKYFAGEQFIPPMALETHSRLLTKLIKISISSEQKEIIRKELIYAGITEANLFPEMDFQAKDI